MDTEYTKYRNPTWGIIQLSIGVLESIICFGCVIFILHFSRSRRRQLQRQDSVAAAVPLPIRLCTLIGGLSFLLSSISQSINFWKWNTTGFSTVQLITWYTNIFCWSFGQFTSYSLFLFRIHAAFSNSIFQVPQSTIVIISILLTFYEMSWIIKCVVPFIFWSDSIENTEFHQNVLYQMQVWMTIPILILDALITIWMTSVFVSRLFRLVMLRNKTAGIGEQDLDHRMISVAIKISLCSISSLVSSLVFISLNAMAYFENFEGPIDKVRVLWLQGDTVISALCLVLVLEGTSTLYNKLCCICKVVCARLMAEELTKRRTHMVQNDFPVKVMPVTVNEKL